MNWLLDHSDDPDPSLDEPVTQEILQRLLPRPAFPPTLGSSSRLGRQPRPAQNSQSTQEVLSVFLRLLNSSR